MKTRHTAVHQNNIYTKLPQFDKTALKEKNILIIFKWNGAKRTDTVWPESNSLLFFMIHAFQMDNDQIDVY